MQNPTDVLLKRGAARVVALDVGHGQLDWGLRNDPRVVVIERANAHGVKAGIHNGRSDVARARIHKGFRFVTLSADTRILAAGSQEILSQMRRA